MLNQISNVDLRLLQVFSCVVRHGGFAAADAELKIGGPAISRHMAELESRLGFRLCQRGRRGFSLTERGKRAFDATMSIFAQLEDFRSELSAIQHHVTGQLNIGIVDGMILDEQFQLARALRELRALSSDVHVRIQVMSPPEIEQQIDDGRIHLGILAHHQTISMFDYFPLQAETLMLYCGRSHELFDAPDADVSPARLENCAYVDRGFTFHPRPRGVTFSEKSAATATQMEGIAFLILSGEYIGHLPDYYARVWVDSGAMRALGAGQFAYEVQITAITRQRRHRSLALQSFLGSLTAGGADHHDAPAAAAR